MSLDFPFPKIYPITDPYISGLPHLQQVKRLTDGGATLIQLRDKQATPAQFFSEAVECVAFARQHGVRIIINDRADIAKAAAADGVHLGQDDMPVAAARSIMGETAIIGISTHSLEQARNAMDLPADYIAIGPAFETSSKVNPDPVVGLDGIRLVRSILGDIPLIAIGGIDEQNVEDVLHAGASSAAMIGAVLKDPCKIAERISLLLNLTS